MSPIAPTAAAARRVVLVLFWANLPWAVAIPWRLTTRRTALADTALGAGLLLEAVALGAVMWAAVTPWAGRRTTAVRTATAVLGALLLWWPLVSRAEPDSAPWSWLAGVTLGAVVVAVRWPIGVGVAALLAIVAALAAPVADQSLAGQLVPLVVSAGLVLLMMVAMVWLLRLLVAAEAARRATAHAAALEERLRVSRDVHDAVGHQMAVIALKAEVAGRSAGTDPARARAETDAIRDLTAATLTEVRRALHGDVRVGLDDQLDGARTVLASAGIDGRFGSRGYPLTPAESALLADVVREAVTNVLRHAAATEVAIAFGEADGIRSMTIVNDGAAASSGTVPGGSGLRGTGLEGLAARCADLHARLEVGREPGARFGLVVTLPARPGR